MVSLHFGLTYVTSIQSKVTQITRWKYILHHTWSLHQPLNKTRIKHEFGLALIPQNHLINFPKHLHHWEESHVWTSLFVLCRHVHMITSMIEAWFTCVYLHKHSYKMIFYSLYFCYLRHEPSNNIIQLLRPFPGECMLTLLFWYDVVANLELNMNYASISQARD